MKEAGTAIVMYLDSPPHMGEARWGASHERTKGSRNTHNIKHKKSINFSDMHSGSLLEKLIQKWGFRTCRFC